MDQFVDQGAERARWLDLDRRLRPALLAGSAVLGLTALIIGAVYGWLAAAPLLLGLVAYFALTTGLGRRARPERWLLSASLLSLSAILACIALADGPKEYLLALPAFPMLGMAPMFPRRISMSAGLAGCAGIVGVALLTYREEVTAMPPMLILPCMLVIITVHTAMAGRDAETVIRGTSVLDPLTGLHNRIALDRRVAEMAHHAAVAGERVGLIVADLDRFKAVNDTYGHATGDAVLVEVARRLREATGPDGRIYRYGGEEFVLLLSERAAKDTAAFAEKLREVVAREPIEGLSCTISLGVAETEPGETLDYPTLFARADAALYAAKQSGRDCVRVERDRSIVASSSTLALPLDPHARHAHLPDGRRPRRAHPRRPRGVDGTLLARDGVERAHMLDVLQRGRADEQFSSAVMTVGLLVAGFWVEWWLLVPPVLASLVWEVFASRASRLRRPEYPALAGLMLIVVAGCPSALLADPQVLFGLPLASAVILGAAAGANRVGTSLLALTALVTAGASGLLIDAGAIAANPVILAVPFALVVANALVGEALGRTVREHRTASITDGLTGMLNRSALGARVPELSRADQPATSVLVLDIDHFKAVNDAFGHAEGDVVLIGLAQRLRAALRTHDSIYRVGGEEFVVILDGVQPGDGVAVAERLRSAVEGSPVEGHPITISIGIEGTCTGQPFDYALVFSAADRRLYEAKRGGRNRVACASTSPDATPELAAAA
ncbi:MAG: diguanylate cyclase [Solirubrobacteraceae bacterium]|nr:diguanylate cyclase [Solirubrobacteraceae bacterium]